MHQTLTRRYLPLLKLPKILYFVSLSSLFHSCFFASSHTLLQSSVTHSLTHSHHYVSSLLFFVSPIPCNTFFLPSYVLTLSIYIPFSLGFTICTFCDLSHIHRQLMPICLYIYSRNILIDVNTYMHYLISSLALFGSSSADSPIRRDNLYITHIPQSYITHICLVLLVIFGMLSLIYKSSCVFL